VGWWDKKLLATGHYEIGHPQADARLRPRRCQKRVPKQGFFVFRSEIGRVSARAGGRSVTGKKLGNFFHPWATYLTERPILDGGRKKFRTGGTMCCTYCAQMGRRARPRGKKGQKAPFWRVLGPFLGPFPLSFASGGRRCGRRKQISKICDNFFPAYPKYLMVLRAFSAH
jgi:hypothetical protein